MNINDEALQRLLESSAAYAEVLKRDEDASNRRKVAWDEVTAAREDGLKLDDELKEAMKKLLEAAASIR